MAEELQNIIDAAPRELPYNREAEQAVIGSVLSTSGENAGAAIEIINPADFYFAANKLVFAAIVELFNENSAIDFVTVANRLGQNDTLDAIGGIEYLRELATSVPTTRHITYYSNIIRDMSIMRNLIKCSEQISKIAYEASEAPEKVLERAEQLVFNVSSSKDGGDISKISDILYDSYLELVENSQNSGGLTGLDTGFVELNKRTGGFHGGELILIAGRPGMGKSSFAVNIAEFASISSGKTVALFNLEMPREQIVNRILCSQARVDSNKIRTGTVEADDWIKISEVLHRVEVAPMYIDDTASITVSQIRAKCRRLMAERGLDLIIIDHIQLMQGSRRTDNRQQEISEISRSLKMLAKDFDIPVLALSQLSRASKDRADKRPLLTDLRESGAIEQDADVVLMLYRDEYYNENTETPGQAEVIIAKHRSGETGKVFLNWQSEYTKFADFDYTHTES